MDGFRKLLIPLDGSHLAEAVLPVARVMAERLHANVSLLHVMEEAPPEKIHGESHLANTMEAVRYLDRIAERCSYQDAIVETHVHPNKERDVVASIIQHAGEFAADLVLITTHGRGGVRDLLVGSIALQVLRRGSLPVLLVKPTAEGGPPPFEGRRMLVPLDGMPRHDGAVLPVLTGLARPLGAEVRLLVVVPTRDTVAGDQAAIARLMPGATRVALEMEEEAAREYLARIEGDLSKVGVKVTAEVRRGDPVATVVERSGTLAADLIVMSTHAKAGLDAFWSGSIGARLLSRIHQPLLLSKARE